MSKKKGLVMDLIGEYEERSFITYRKVVADMVEIASKKHQMKGSIAIDITYAREKLRQYKAITGESQSFTAWFVKCVAQAVSENKQTHGIRKGKKIIIFNDVDVFVLIETMLGESQVALPYVVRSADKKSCREIHMEIRAAQKHNADDQSIMIGNKSWLMGIYPHIPRPVRMLICRIVTHNPFYIKANTGTVSVSSVGMMGNVNGWIYPISPLPLSFAVCGITKKPGIIDNKIEIREELNIAFTADHDIIDGAQLFRFLSRLTELMEEGFNLEFPL